MSEDYGDSCPPFAGFGLLLLGRTLFFPNTEVSAFSLVVFVYFLSDGQSPCYLRFLPPRNLLGGVFFLVLMGLFGRRTGFLFLGVLVHLLICFVSSCLALIIIPASHFFFSPPPP